MLYDRILLDVSNLFYRLQHGQKNSLNIVRKMITFTESEIKTHLTKTGELYLLFDPINFSDLGEHKNFAVPLNERKKILPDYKEGRTYSPLFYDCIELYRKYYIYRGDRIKLVYSDEYECDDFVEPLLEKFEKEWKDDNTSRNIALITTDLDFSRYIKKEPNLKIQMINEGFKNPYTIKQFEEVFEFKPTIAANIVYKSLFGDKSDNITGALFMKKAKFNINVKTLARDYIQVISKENKTLDEVIKEFKDASFAVLNNKKDKNAFDMLYLAMAIVDLKIPILEKFFTNIRVIKCACRNVEPYIHCNPIQQKTNEILHQSIFGVEFKTVFGKI